MKSKEKEIIIEKIKGMSSEQAEKVLMFIAGLNGSGEKNRDISQLKDAKTKEM